MGMSSYGYKGYSGMVLGGQSEVFDGGQCDLADECWWVGVWFECVDGA